MDARRQTSGFGRGKFDRENAGRRNRSRRHIKGEEDRKAGRTGTLGFGREVPSPSGASRGQPKRNVASHLARAEAVTPDEITICHVVRRCFLMGHDPLIGKSYDHRKGWGEQQRKRLAQAFASSLLRSSRWDHLSARVPKRRNGTSPDFREAVRPEVQIANQRARSERRRANLRRACPKTLFSALQQSLTR